MTFDARGRGGDPQGYHRGCKVIPSPHTRSVRLGETWLVEEVLHYEAGSAAKNDNPKAKDYMRWGPVVYVWPLRRLL